MHWEGDVMSFIEFNWTANCWQFRIGDRFTDFRGVRSWKSLKDAKRHLAFFHLQLTKTDSRTYRVENTPTEGR
jgi:hypothetical protein